MLGEKIRRVGVEHLGRAIVHAYDETRLVVPISIEDHLRFNALVFDKVGVDSGWNRDDDWHIWLPDEEKPKNPIRRLGKFASASTGWCAEAEEILDDLDARLRAVEEK